MKKLLFVLLIGFGFFKWYFGHEAVTASSGVHHERVIMYALTTCGFCKEKARALNEEGIRFTEYYIDQDFSRKDELNEKLRKAGFPPRQYGTPIMDVHGVMLLNNPSMAEIKKHLES